ncbi:MAG: redoxin domain-containing protein [Dehalococcoidia bacterium]|nr:redoxin domain-containing protein [Dehalococcoidia bacterium]
MQGQHAPDFRLESTAGDQVALSSMLGRWVVLVFSRHNC